MMTSDNDNSGDAVALERALDAQDWADLERHLSSKSIAETSAWLLGLEDWHRQEVLSELASRERPSGAAESSEPDFLHVPYLTMIWKRLGWLVVLMIGQMFTATVLDYFDEQLERALVLALFIPMIISSGGNSGSQASTLLIRAMAMGQVRSMDWWRVIYRELLIGATLGVVLGLVAFARVALTNQGYGPHWAGIGLTIGLSTAFVVLCGSLLGSILPLLLRACRTDPATSSAPFVATLADVTGLIIYFSTAILILKGTVL